MGCILGAVGNFPFSLIGWIWGGVFIAGSLYAVLKRRRALKDAVAATAPDREKYEHVWQNICATQTPQLVLLSALAKSHSNAKKVQPWSSVEKVFEISACINEWYQEVVQTWADHCGVKAYKAPLKSFQRTMEKIVRAYKGKVPLVLDIVRSTVVTETVKEALDVLEVVLANSIVHVIKNRFDIDYDGSDTAGYRDINLQLSFPETNGSEFEGFVFELQIHLRPILDLKNDEGHKRYIKVRNLRGD